MKPYRILLDGICLTVVETEEDAREIVNKCENCESFFMDWGDCFVFYMTRIPE